MYHIDSPALKVEHKKGMCYINAALKQLYRGSCPRIAPCCCDHYAEQSLLGWIFTCGRWLGKNKTCNVQKVRKNGSVLSSWSAQTVNSVYSTSSNQFCCNPADRQTRENTMSLAEVTSLQISLISEIQFNLETSAWKLLFLLRDITPICSHSVSLPAQTRERKHKWDR